MSDAVTAEDEVLSGEAVAIDVQPVGFFFRVLGALIDVVVSIAVFVGIIMLQLWAASVFGVDEAVNRILTVASIVFAFVVLPVAIEVLTHGRSLGKLAVGGRIVRLDGGAAGFRHAFIRAVIGVLEIYMTFGALAILAGAFTARSQRLGDMIAGTYSQRVRTPRLVSIPPVMPPALADWARIADVARMPDRLARRISQFLHTADRMLPAARARIAHDLLVEAAPFISPLPSAPDEVVLLAATALRRERETRALHLADARAEKLSGARLGV